ncbi:hypothetical protein SISNIDRAFT_459480 [Sistotremastrum niveocremeum HHB9708]|uniref:RING-type domain-containing protein n=1 Tax=Sistotremastrum niveocremeum HHB9708 TaxID=1314777 RepID=A0A164PEF3_9AGAM|nr:hypothetical protein SISNIDRAFT_459480 [Sistotremastrum niveocremeum HHB9708]
MSSLATTSTNGRPPHKRQKKSHNNIPANADIIDISSDDENVPPPARARPALVPVVELVSSRPEPVPLIPSGTPPTKLAEQPQRRHPLQTFDGFKPAPVPEGSQRRPFLQTVMSSEPASAPVASSSQDQTKLVALGKEVAALKRQLVDTKNELAAYHLLSEEQATAIRDVNDAQTRLKAEIQQLKHDLKKAKKSVQAAPNLNPLSDLITCEICTLTMWEPYTLSQCGHTYCATCLSDWFLQNARSGVRYTCPTCRAAVQIAPVQAYKMKEFIEMIAKQVTPNERPPRQDGAQNPFARFFGGIAWGYR